jgi:hypothetical protein
MFAAARIGLESQSQPNTMVCLWRFSGHGAMLAIASLSGNKPEVAEMGNFGRERPDRLLEWSSNYGSDPQGKNNLN